MSFPETSKPATDINIPEATPIALPPAIDVSKPKETPTTPPSAQAEQLRERQENAINVNQHRLEIIAGLPDNAQTEAARRATYVNMYRKTNDRIAVQMSGEDWQNYLQSGTQVIEDMKSADTTNKKDWDKIVSDRAKGLKSVLALTKPPAPGKTPSFESTRFVMAVEKELLNARDTLPVLTDDAQRNAINREIHFLEAILQQFNLPTDEETLRKYDVLGHLKPDEKNNAWRQTAKDLGRIGIILGTGTVFFGILATTIFSETENTQSAMIWGALFALGLWGPELTKSKVQKLKEEMAFTKGEDFQSNLDRLAGEASFMQGADFQGFSADHRGKLAKIAEKFFEPGNREKIMKALRTLKSEKNDEKARQKKEDARETLLSILGNDPDTQALLKDEEKFLNFALPILEHARSTQSQQLVLTYLENAKPPTPEMLTHNPPPDPPEAPTKKTRGTLHIGLSTPSTRQA